jgi:hypothetical protein
MATSLLLMLQSVVNASIPAEPVQVYWHVIVVIILYTGKCFWEGRSALAWSDTLMMELTIKPANPAITHATFVKIPVQTAQAVELPIIEQNQETPAYVIQSTMMMEAI